jgi:hypothetical protein
MAELLDLPTEVLTEICLYLTQKDLHKSMALVSKSFLQLTKSAQLLKCVDINMKPCYYSKGTRKKKSKFRSILAMLRNNKHLQRLHFQGPILHPEHTDILEILKVVAPRGSLRHLELCNVDDRDSVKTRAGKSKVLSQIFANLTTYVLSGNYSGRYDMDDYLDPLVNAKNLTTLRLDTMPTSKTLRHRLIIHGYIRIVTLAAFKNLFCKIVE